jgi:hypothetical protein
MSKKPESNKGVTPTEFPSSDAVNPDESESQPPDLSKSEPTPTTRKATITVIDKSGNKRKVTVTRPEIIHDLQPKIVPPTPNKLEVEIEPIPE